MNTKEEFVKVGNLYHPVISNNRNGIECSEHGLTESQLRDYFATKALERDPLAQEFHLKVCALRNNLSELRDLSCKLVMENEGILDPGSENFNGPFSFVHHLIMKVCRDKMI